MTGAKILIVEDDQTAAAIMQLYLGSMGYEIDGIATTGWDAIEMARSHQPDLVLMDINLGKGLNGIDAAQIINKHYHTPIIFVTAHADADTLERAKDVEPAGYINKPLRETDIKTTIELALARTKERPKKKPERSGPAIPDILMSLYSLTRTEALVLEKLIEHPELNYAAQALDISVATARTHLKRIFHKTNTNRQSILVHKIVTGPVGLLLNQNNGPNH